MKASIFILASTLLTFSACSHQPTRSNREVSRASSNTAPAPVSPVIANDGGTVSGAPTSLGSSSSGRGH